MKMSNDYRGLLVIIPTRNRSNLVTNAIMSVLNQPNCEDVKVLVSDNSTEANEIEKLSYFCEQNQDDRLRYLKTPESMPMTTHWEWAINQALELSDFNHILYLTDRMIFRQGQLETIINLVKHYPDKIISYNHDRINDVKQPILLEQCEWTGKMLEINSEHLLSLNSQLIFHPCLPRLLNSVVPRFVFLRLKNRYGNIFSSVSPDFCFCYRCLEMIESFLYYDKSILVHYAIGRSNGASMLRGVVSKDHADFVKNMPRGFSLNCFSPIPEIYTVTNAVLQEYYFVKSETQSSKFPEIDRHNYLNHLAGEIAYFENEQIKTKMLAILSSYGWQENAVAKTSFKSWVKYLIRRLKLTKIVNKVRERIVKKPNIPAFNTTAEALEYANQHDREKTLDTRHLHFLVGELGAIHDLPQ